MLNNRTFKFAQVPVVLLPGTKSEVNHLSIEIAHNQSTKCYMLRVYPAQNLDSGMVMLNLTGGTSFKLESVPRYNEKRLLELVKATNSRANLATNSPRERLETAVRLTLEKYRFDFTLPEAVTPETLLLMGS